MTDNDDTLYKDLVSFLKQLNRPDLLSAATDACLQVVASSSASSRTNNKTAIQKLIDHGAVPLLCRLMTHPGVIGYNALETLFIMTFQNILSSSRALTTFVTNGVDDETQRHNVEEEEERLSQLDEILLESNTIERAIDVALSFSTNNNNKSEKRGQDNTTDNKDSLERKHVYHAMAFLANLTRSEKGAASFLLGGKKHLKKVVKGGEEQENGDNENNNSATIISPSVKLLFARFLSDQYIIKKDDSNSMINSDTIFGAQLQEDISEAINMNDSDNEENKTDDPYVHFSSILTNITQINAGRNLITSMHTSTSLASTSSFSSFLLNNNSSNNSNSIDQTTSTKNNILPPTMMALLHQLRQSHHSALRRRNIACTIKNCCFDTNQNKLWILPLRNIVYTDEDDESSRLNSDLVCSLLYPLIGPEEIEEEHEKILLDPLLHLDDLIDEDPYKSIRETDGPTRLNLIETILLLCASGRSSREILRSKGTYIILKYADRMEENEEISLKIMECIQFLRRDEEGAKNEGESDNIALEMAKARQAVRLATRENDYDAVD